MEKLQDFSESHNFPVKNHVKWLYMVKGLSFKGVLICIQRRSLSNPGEGIYGPSHAKDGYQNSRDCPLLQETWWGFLKIEIIGGSRGRVLYAN